MLRTFWTLRVMCFLLSSIQSSAYMMYRDRIPNGHRIPHPCIEGEIWQGVGHLDPQGGGARNPFGIDFKETGRFEWTVELCELDSDGDGFTNGEELGDPDCLWSRGNAAQRTTNITHPGICTPFYNESCADRSTFVNCKKIEPNDELQCENLNRTEVYFRDYNFPRTKVPNKETTYVCQTFNAPTDEDTYLIGMEPLIDQKNIVHHMIIYGCFENTPITTEPVECTMGSHCPDIIGAWALGVPGLCLPNDVGFLFGPHGYKKLQLEFHWDNPLLLDNQYDASGMRMHFEPTRSGMSTAGLMMMGSLMLEIPPHQIHHEEYGFCDGECTSQYWNGSLNLFGAANHMHYIGVQQRTSLWRNGSKVRDLAYDLNASFDNPVYHRFDPPVVLNPGDSIETTCVYDSSNRKRTTYYGEGTSDEMCHFFAFYYPMENSRKTYCNSMGPLSECKRIARAPIGNCDWNSFTKGVTSQSLPIAQDLRLNCAITGHCQPECRRVVEELKRHPCMQDNVLLFIATRLQGSAEGARFLARYSSCADDMCPDHGQRSAWSSKGVLVTMTTVTIVLKFLA